MANYPEERGDHHANVRIATPPASKPDKLLKARYHSTYSASSQATGSLSATEDCKYYLCDSPMLIQAVIRMLDDLSVPPENILIR